MAWAVALTLAHGIISLTLPHGLALTALSDTLQFVLLTLASIVIVTNAVASRGQNRLFWSLLATGCVMWTVNMALWTVYEVVLRREIPDPFVGDVILFLHIVPFMAAIALCPHRMPEDQKPYFGTLNSLMLLVWWVFLYAFIVFPDEYVVLNLAVYTRSFDLLYLAENLMLMAALGLLASSTQGAWKRIYWNLFFACSLYTYGSQAIDAAIARGWYYSGSIYDIPFVASIVWLIWSGLLALELRPSASGSGQPRRWLALAPRAAMLAILSLPLMGYWAWFMDTSPPKLRQFRLLVTLAAMLVLGLFVFLRQYLLDQELVRLLQESGQSLENLQRLQTQLVQREKLASLGQVVAGAAHELNHPLTAILGYSGRLVASPGLEAKQVSMAEKIGQQARRTQELVSGLLSFAQQSPGDKTLVDLGALLQRALQMEMLRMKSQNIRVESRIAPDLPGIWGNANQLYRCCLEIIGNAMDALGESGGGTFSLNAWPEGDEDVIEFSDSGLGIREPQRVFDPFYTTKPVGKGAGLGLSATYGVVQDHHGHISCHNRPEGGAVFVLRFPIAQPTAIEAVQAAKA